MNIFDITPPATVVDANGQVKDATATNTVGGADPAGQSPSSAAPNLTTIKPDGTLIDPEKNKEPTVVLDGPLGRIYTQALKLAYANEDTGTMSAIVNMGSDGPGGEGEPASGTYVYAMDMSDLSANELLNAHDWMLRRNKLTGASLIISLEAHGGKLSPKCGLVEDLAKSVGAKVYYSRESTFNAIKRQTTLTKR